MSSKGLKYNVTRYQREGVTSAKCKQAKRCMEHVSVLIMASKEKVCSVKNELAVFSKRYQDLNESTDLLSATTGQRLSCNAK